MLCHFAEGTGVGLAAEEVDHSAHEFVPLLPVVLLEVVPDLYDVRVDALDAAIDVALLGVSDRPELVLLLHHLREVPQLGRPAHVFALEGVVHGLHVLQGLGRALELFVLALLPGQHPISDDGVLDVLVHCLVDVLQLLHRRLDHLVAEVVVAVVLPDPVAAQLLDFQLELRLLPLLRLLLDLAGLGLQLGVEAEGLLGAAGVDVEGRAVAHLAFLVADLRDSQQLQVLLLLLADLGLLVAVEAHALDGLEGDEPGHGEVHGVGVLLDEVLLGQPVGLGNVLQHFGREVDLVPQQVVAEEALDDEVPVDEPQQVLHELLVELDGHLPEVDAGGEERAESLLHGVEGLAVGREVEGLDLGEVGVGQFLEDVSGLDHELDGPGVVGAEYFEDAFEAEAVAVDNGVVLELVHELLLLGGVLELVQGELHVDLEQVGEGLQHHQQFLLEDHLEGLLDVRLHEVVELAEALLEVSAGLVVVVDVEVAVELSGGRGTSAMTLQIFLMRAWRRLCCESPSTGSYSQSTPSKTQGGSLLSTLRFSPKQMLRIHSCSIFLKGGLIFISTDNSQNRSHSVWNLPSMSESFEVSLMQLRPFSQRCVSYSFFHSSLSRYTYHYFFSASGSAFFGGINITYGKNINQPPPSLIHCHHWHIVVCMRSPCSPCRYNPRWLFAQEQIQSNQFWLHEHDLPQMTDMLLLADFQPAVLLEQSLAVAHAQLALAAADPHEPPVPAFPEAVHVPHLPRLRPHHAALLVPEEALREGVVDVDVDRLVLVLAVGWWLGRVVVGADELPDVVLCDVVGVEGAAADLVEVLAVGQLDLVGVQVVLCFNVAEDQWVSEGVRLAQRVELVQRLVEDLQLLVLHLHDAAHEHRALLEGQFGERVVQVLPEGVVDLGGEAGVVNGLFLVDDGVGLVLALALVVPAGVPVGLPLLLLRVADAHQYYGGRGVAWVAARGMMVYWGYGSVDNLSADACAQDCAVDLVGGVGSLGLCVVVLLVVAAVGLEVAVGGNSVPELVGGAGGGLGGHVAGGEVGLDHGLSEGDHHKINTGVVLLEVGALHVAVAPGNVPHRHSGSGSDLGSGVPVVVGVAGEAGRGQHNQCKGEQQSPAHHDMFIF